MLIRAGGIADKSALFRMAASASIAAALGLLTACFDSRDGAPDVQGPGSETVGLQGGAQYVEGAPAISAKVVARPAGYWKDTAERAPQLIPGKETDTDGKGAFMIAPIAVDSYSVEIRGDSGRAARLQCVVAADQRTRLDEAILKPVGVMTGRVARLRASQASVWIQVRGMERLAYIAPDSARFAFADLPPGRYTIRAMSPDPVLGSVIVPEVEIRSGETTDLGEIILDAFTHEDYAQWAHGRALAIRTGPAGADIAAGVKGFPLLVRLDSAAFPFDTSAAADGSDIRFAGATGGHLPYEIENWDPVGKHALLWVKVDSLRAGDDAQTIRMLWGRKGSTSLSSGPAVFDTAAGYRSVWHLQHQALTERYGDATARGNTAYAKDPAAVGEASSPLFRCIELDGKQGLLATTDSARAPQAFTLSLWFRAHGTGKLIGFESGTGPYDRHLWIEPDGSIHFGVYIADPPVGTLDMERNAISLPGYIDGQWHHLAASQDPAAGMSLYVDGKPAGSNADVPHAEDITGRWILGGGMLGGWSPAIKDQTHFTGALDEVRVRHVPESAAWIKLAFESQKAGSTVVRFLDL